MGKILPFVLVGLVVAAFAVGGAVRLQIPVQFSPESIHLWVKDLGWLGPVVYVALVTFRQFLLLPSAVVLPVGGLCFGVLAGTGLGAAGIVISALMKYALARGVGRRWIRPRLRRRFLKIESRLDRAGPLLVALGTAHPIGPMAPLHWAAGLSSIPLTGFFLAVVIGGPLRAAAYSYLGSTLMDLGSPQFYVASALLLAAILLPFLHPAFRRRVFRALPLNDSSDLPPAA